jgi:hypothetical protein
VPVRRQPLFPALSSSLRISPPGVCACVGKEWVASASQGAKSQGAKGQGAKSQGAKNHQYTHTRTYCLGVARGERFPQGVKIKVSLVK